MTLFDYEKDNILDYSDDSLRILKDKIEKELERREQEKEAEAKKKIIQAIQDYLATGYTLWVDGEIEMPDEDYNADYVTVSGSVHEVELKNNEVSLKFFGD